MHPLQWAHITLMAFMYVGRLSERTTGLNSAGTGVHQGAHLSSRVSAVAVNQSEWCRDKVSSPALVVTGGAESIPNLVLTQGN